jgi:hypothetical protein
MRFLRNTAHRAKASLLQPPERGSGESGLTVSRQNSPIFTKLSLQLECAVLWR